MLRRKFNLSIPWAYSKIEVYFELYSKNSLYDIGFLCPKSAHNIYSFLIGLYCIEQRELSDFLSKDVSNFLEFDVEKATPFAENENIDQKMFFDMNRNKYAYSHLHLYEIHKMYILTSEGTKMTAKMVQDSQRKMKREKTRFEVLNSEEKKEIEQKKPEKILHSIFLDQKLDQQRRMKRRIYYENSTDNNNDFNEEEASRQDFETLYNDFIILQNSKNEIVKELKESQEIIKQLKQENKELKERQTSLNTQVDKNKFHKELLSKEIASTMEDHYYINLKPISENHTFRNIMDEQLTHVKQWKSVAKFGLRWLKKVREKLYKV